MRKFLVGLLIISVLISNGCITQRTAIGTTLAGVLADGINEPGLNVYHRGNRGGCYYIRVSQANKPYKMYVAVAKCDRFKIL